MAPELLDDCLASVESDTWAFEMTTPESSTREVPFRDCRNPVNVLCGIMKGKLPPRPGEESTQFRMTDTWWEICTSCWGRDPLSRLSMRDITKKVKAAISQIVPATTLLEGSEAGGYARTPNLEVTGSNAATGEVPESATSMKAALE